MPNVSLDSCITTFCEQKNAEKDISKSFSADYLHAREMAERAAAKRSSSRVARAVHQELAQLYADQRRRIGGRAW